MRDLSDDVSLMSETNLLKEIKRLAVKEESILVHRMKLGKMTQAPGMGIRTFLANLRGQAALCKFQAKCNQAGCQHIFDYSNEIIKDNLIRGISDPDILTDLLGDVKTDRTLEEVVNFIAQKEQGKATRHAVGDSTHAIAHNTSHPQGKQNSKSDNPGKCWACGGLSHSPRNDRSTRSQKCPAWTVVCNKCNVKGHYQRCCSKCTDCGAWGHRDANSRFCKRQKDNRRNRTLQVEDENLFTDQLVAMHQNSQTVDHHVYDGKWISRPSKPHPRIIAELMPLPKEHAQLGNKIPTSTLKPTVIPMIADSGCQSSIIPWETALSMGYKTDDMMQVSMSMRGAIKEDLGVERGIVVKVSVSDDSGSTRSCIQLVYLSKKINKAFLCREALEQLGIISPQFPDIQADTNRSFSTSNELKPDTKCVCPKRPQEVPPLPQSLPITLTGSAEKDALELRTWLLDYYGGTTFNTCEHQPLPMMKCEPLRLFLDPNAKPVAVHKPAVVPIHWRDQVYAGLERDVALGVLEKVVPNDPVTWCSRMVVTAKADGTPRRTVDL